MTAVIVRVHLPERLERIRRRSIGDAAEGVPAHITLLYPFVELGGLDAVVRRRIANVTALHAPIGFRLQSIAAWPDTIYVALDPAAPFASLQADLQAAFPDHPIYGRSEPAFSFVPHVTIAEGRHVEDPSVRAEIGRRLPSTMRKARFVEVITTAGGPCRTVWRIALNGGAGGPSARYDSGP